MKRHITWIALRKFDGLLRPEPRQSRPVEAAVDALERDPAGRGVVPGRSLRGLRALAKLATFANLAKFTMFAT